MDGNQNLGYGGSAPSPFEGVSSEVQQWFNTVDSDHSGHIKCQELQSALINSQGKTFSESTCQMMIAMFDTDRTGTIDINEFQHLFSYVNQWLALFGNFDRDQSGYIEEAELSQALQQMGFRFTPEFIKSLMAKSDFQPHGRLSVEQFIVLCVQIQRLTDAFRARDHEMTGVITISFEDFLGVAINGSV